MELVWTVSVANLVALAIALGLLAHTIWFVRRTDRWRVQMRQVLAEITQERDELRAELDQARAAVLAAKEQKPPEH